MMQTDGKDLADRLGKEADDLERRNQELGERTKDVAQEWESKRSDPNVPGAPPNDDDDDYDEDEDGDKEHDGEGWDDPDEEEEDEDYDEDE